GWDPTALPAGVYLIDVIGGVTNNFEEIYNNIVNEEITVNGDEYNSFEEYITHVTESTGDRKNTRLNYSHVKATYDECGEITNTRSAITDTRASAVNPLSLHDALPIWMGSYGIAGRRLPYRCNRRSNKQL